LIENAVRHGISKRIGGGTVRMILDRNTTDFSVTVENEADSGFVSESKFFQPGHALHNIRERLRLIYAGRASIEVRSPRENVVAVTIRVPVVVMMSRDPMRHS
jgi:LytS/YehU family sensor histidine kinase